MNRFNESHVEEAALTTPFATLLRFAKFAQKPVTGGTPYIRHLPMMFAKDHGFRALPAIADRMNAKRLWVEGTEITDSAASKGFSPSVAMTIGAAL